MIKIISRYIPFKGFLAITIFPFIFIRKDCKDMFTLTVENHENIHGEQQKEMLVLLFLLWYIIEYLFKWAYYHNSITAYKNISFEREAYTNQYDQKYIGNRKWFSWVKYIRQ